MRVQILKEDKEILQDEVGHLEKSSRQCEDSSYEFKGKNAELLGRLEEL